VGEVVGAVARMSLPLTLRLTWIWLLLTILLYLFVGDIRQLSKGPLGGLSQAIHFLQVY
jgi:hypothetical protein